MSSLTRLDIGYAIGTHCMLNTNFHISNFDKLSVTRLTSALSDTRIP